MLVDNFTTPSEGGGGATARVELRGGGEGRSCEPKTVVALGTSAQGRGCGCWRRWLYREGHMAGAHDATPAVVDW
jgi:hypothetical protein